MCLSTAYETTNGIDKLICERITNVEVEGKTVKFTNLLGIQTVVPGVLKSIDLNKNIILIEPAS